MKIIVSVLDECSEFTGAFVCDDGECVHAARMWMAEEIRECCDVNVEETVQQWLEDSARATSFFGLETVLERSDNFPIRVFYSTEFKEY